MSQSTSSILEILTRHGVEFIVIGGSAALLNGVPLVTFDVDVVHLRESVNIEKRLAALQELHARYRMRPDLAPNESHLASAGHQLLITKYGALDVRGEIGESGKGMRYEDLLGRTHTIDAGDLPVRILDLDFLIELKEQSGRDKDKAALPVLRTTLAEKKRLKGKTEARRLAR